MCLLSCSSFGYGQLYTRYAKGANIDSLVQALFGSPNVQILNIQFTGAYESYFDVIQDIGYFNSTNSSVGINEGMALTGGYLHPPYGLGQSAVNSNVDLKVTPGDSLLDIIIAPFHTSFAAVLEFDFIPNGDSIQFNYVFASEEYPDQICNEDNDVFAFHISGPGISGQKNIALIPGTNLPVGNNSVNDTSATIYVDNLDLSLCQSVNYPQYYVDHTGDTKFIFNGSTTVLTARAATIPCQTYHLRFAVAEGHRPGDFSIVFLEANSFNSEPLSIESSISYGNGDTLLYEGCGYAQIVINRTYNIQQSKTYSISVGGTASNGVDYATVPTQITMQPGISSDTLIITPFLDMVADNGESIILTIGDTLCNGNYFETSLQLTINEKPNYSVKIFPDTGVFCNNALFQCELQGAIPPINYNWNSGLSLDSIFDYYPDFTGDFQSTQIYLNTIDACGNATKDSIDVIFSHKPSANFIFNPSWIDLLNPKVKFTNTSSSDVVKWLWNFDEDGITSPFENPIHLYSDTGEYIISLFVENKFNCIDSIQKVLRINDIPNIYVPNTFTPNNDGNNDFFQIIGVEIDEFEVSIYNRWGEVIFHSINQDDRWNGEDAMDGVYSYKLSVRFKNGQYKSILGSVTLIR